MSLHCFKSYSKIEQQVPTDEHPAPLEGRAGKRRLRRGSGSKEWVGACQVKVGNGASGRKRSMSTGTEASKWSKVFADTWNINISNKSNSLSRCLKCFKSVELCKFFHMNILTDFFNPLSYDEYWFFIGKYGHTNSNLSIFWYPNI